MSLIGVLDFTGDAGIKYTLNAKFPIPVCRVCLRVLRICGARSLIVCLSPDVSRYASTRRPVQTCCFFAYAYASSPLRW